MRRLVRTALAGVALAALTAPASAMNAETRAPFFLFPFFSAPQAQHPAPQQYQGYAPEPAKQEASSRPTREIVSYYGQHAAGTVVVNTSERRLYYVLGGGKAIRYAVGVGRE